MKLTKEQEKAVKGKGTLLVSAAAGSGKTAVLTQRVLDKILDEENPVDIDRLLIITFTNAAASEMRERISKSLTDYIEENPYNVRAKTQKLLLDSAYITTIDAFCIDFIKENSADMGLSAEFKVTSEEQLALMRENALNSTLSKFYKENIEQMSKLLDTIDPDRGEEKLKELIERIYFYSRSLAFPYDWFDYAEGLYENVKSFNETVWSNIIYEYVFEHADFCLSELYNAKYLLEKDEAISRCYFASVSDLISNCEALKEGAQQRNFNDIYSVIRGYSTKKTTPVKGEYDVIIKEVVNLSVKKAREFIGEVKELFDCDEQSVIFEMKLLKENIGLIFSMVKELYLQLDQLKKEKNCLDFADVEYAVLNFLVQKDSNGKIVKTEKAEEISSHYKEIMIDEYQDTNHLQNEIFSALSQGDNLFYVGDVKQCIYKFRNASPDNFINKKKNYPDYQEGVSPSKVTLSGNFRSRPEICSFVNFVFSLIMTEKATGLEYCNEDKLVSLGNFLPTDYDKVEMAVIQSDKTEDSANHIAEYIKRSVKEKMQVSEGESLRDCRYGDFMILLRARTHLMDFVNALKEAGIPVWAEIREGFFEGAEIKLALSLLRVIDNPMRDVALLSVMLSPIFSFSTDEVANIRADSKNESLYKSVLKHKDNPKCEKMLSRLEKYRLWSASMPADKLILRLYADTALLAICGAMPDGSSRQANLKLLSEYASQYEEQGYKGLSEFLRYITSVQKSGSTVRRASFGDDNAVKVTTIHNSKGLQVPVCILACTDNKFMTRDLSNFVMNETYGIGMHFCDFEKGVKYDTIQRKAIAKEELKQLMSEEMRLMYVAMTRAVDKLVILATDNNFEKHATAITSAIAQENSSLEDPIDYVTVSSAKSMYDWLLMSLTLHKDAKAISDYSPFDYHYKPTDSTIKFNVYSYADRAEAEETEKTAFEPYDFSETLGFEYPYKDVLDIQSKYTPSQFHNDGKEEFLFTNTPSFVTGDKLTGSARGTAIHKFMQYADYNSAEKDLLSEADRILSIGSISNEERQAIDKKVIEPFFKTKEYDIIKTADKVIRECHFVTEISVKEIKPETESNETTCLDGTADVVVFKNGEITVIDFKTDRVKQEQELISRYSKQLELYEKALSKIYSMPVKQKLIYSFCLNKFIIL